MTIRDLLNRIRWDPEFGRAEFVLGYYDRVEDRIIRVSFAWVDFDPADHTTFQLTDAAGEPLAIPLHRIRAVWRDGVLIWQRGAANQHGSA